MRSRTFALKLKWRRIAGHVNYHCFDRAFHRPKRYISLCDSITIKQSYGAECSRPAAPLRCAQCDIEEMKLLGIDESAEPSKPKR